MLKQGQIVSLPGPKLWSSLARDIKLISQYPQTIPLDTYFYCSAVFFQGTWSVLSLSLCGSLPSPFLLSDGLLVIFHPPLSLSVYLCFFFQDIGRTTTGPEIKSATNEVSITYSSSTPCVDDPAQNYTSTIVFTCQKGVELVSLHTPMHLRGIELSCFLFVTYS